MCHMLLCRLFFFFKQKTAYEMRISDWSSDVCSSDLSGWLASSRAPQPQYQGDGHLECGGVEMRARGNVGRVQHGFAHLFDLQADRGAGVVPMAVQVLGVRNGVALAVEPEIADPAERMADRDRQSVVEGKRVSVRGGLGGRRSINK